MANQSVIQCPTCDAFMGAKPGDRCIACGFQWVIDSDAIEEDGGPDHEARVRALEVKAGLDTSAHDLKRSWDHYESSESPYAVMAIETEYQGYGGGSGIIPQDRREYRQIVGSNTLMGLFNILNTWAERK